MDTDPGKTSLYTWERWFLFTLIISALALRCVYLLEIRDNPFFEHPRLDALYHDRWAASIVTGDILGDKVFFRAPLYPYTLATLYALFGHNYVAPRIFQHLLGVLSLVLLYLLTRRLFDIRTAILTSIIALLYGVFIYFEGELLFESLLVFSCLGWLVITEQFKARPSSFRWLLVGIVNGLICCIRPTFLAIAPIVFGGIVWRIAVAGSRSKAIKTFLLLAIGCILPILPITVRNYIVGHDFVLIAYQGGVNFYIGNNESANGHSSMMPGPRGASWENRDQTYQVEKALGHPPLPSEESWFWYKQGLAFVIEQPRQYLALLARKAYLFWNWYEIPNNQDFYSFRKHSTVLQILPLGFWIVGPLGMLGFVIALRHQRGSFHVAFILLYCFITVLFFVCDRFRLPIVPLLCMFAAYALVKVYEKVGERNWTWLSVHAAIGTCAFFFVNSNLHPIDKETESRDFLSLGIVALELGNFEQAISCFQKSRELEELPRPNLCLNWGAAEWGLGNMEAAIQKFRDELRFYPDADGALSNLSFVYLSMGMTDSTLLYGRRAIELKPYLPKPYIAMAQAYQKLGEMENAAAILERGLRSCKHSFASGELLLAGTYTTLDRIDLAEQHYKALIARKISFDQPFYEPDQQFVGKELVGEDGKRLRARAMYGLGHVWAVRRNLDSSLAYFKAAVDEFPTYGDAWADMGVALMNTHRNAEAERVLQHAVFLEPQNHMYWFNYATLLGTQGRLDDARIAFNRVLSIRPDFEPAHRNIALIEKLSQKQKPSTASP